MSDTELRLSFNSHRLSALERILTESGSSVENELQHELNDLYKNLVPEDEQNEIESRIERETAEENATREVAKRFAVIRFQENRDDIHFTVPLRDGFFSAANLYSHYIKDEVGKYPLEIIAGHFGDYNPIDGFTFSALCDSMPNNQRITALMDFDFDDGTVSVCESSDNAWWTYTLEDVSTAVYHAERNTEFPFETMREVFYMALAGKDIDMGSDEQMLAEDDTPTMQM